LFLSCHTLVSMDETIHKKKCIWGDGCLVRLSDQEHEDAYIHTISDIQKCPIEGCPLYQKAYDYVVGRPGTPFTLEIREAQKHAALHYHPPIRSRTVAKVRPKSKDRRHTDGRIEIPKKLSVPKLHLESIPPSIPQQTLSKSRTATQSAPERKMKTSSPPRLSGSLTPEKANSDPTRKYLAPQAITISPKRRATSFSYSQLDTLSRDVALIKTDLEKTMDVLKIELRDLRKDVTIIKEILVSAVEAEEKKMGNGVKTKH